jgi:hypothetical protein
MKDRDDEMECFFLGDEPPRTAIGSCAKITPVISLNSRMFDGGVE